MIEPDSLNPLEVLTHLHTLGFTDVSPQQLEDFIHDLKKLIRYEQKHQYKYCNHCTTSKFPDVDSNCSCGKLDSSEKFSDADSCASSSLSDCCSSNHDSALSNDESNKFNKLLKPEGSKDNLVKAQSSFIRPRNLSNSKSTSLKNKKKLDPVNLYHHYRELWRRNKIPGKSNHSQLRWDIRNKMLGQEPN